MIRDNLEPNLSLLPLGDDFPEPHMAREREQRPPNGTGIVLGVVGGLCLMLALSVVIGLLLDWARG